MVLKGTPNYQVTVDASAAQSSKEDYTVFAFNPTGGSNVALSSADSSIQKGTTQTFTSSLNAICTEAWFICYSSIVIAVAVVAAAAVIGLALWRLPNRLRKAIIDALPTGRAP